MSHALSMQVITARLSIAPATVPFIVLSILLKPGQID
jgi:hypothetical protein